MAWRTLGTFGVAALLLVAWATATEAHITRIVITRVESPTFEGTSFGDVGPYEKLVGRAYGEIDPNDPRSVVITDIALAPRNARGMVEYSTDIYIFKPVDLTRGNHRSFFELNNRGNITLFGQINDAATGGNDPTTAADAGIGFLMRQGYTIVESGWDATVAAGGGRLTIAVPVATQADGSSIVGPALEELVVDNSTTFTGTLTYPAATLDKSRANLTVRVHYEDPTENVPAASWEYVNDRTIRLLPSGTPFVQGRLYEFTYLAKDPAVAGLGFAAIRDIATFLRRSVTDEGGTPNPLGDDVRFVYSYCFSQPCRFMHDFLQLGFNEDEHGRRVFDGILNWVGGASGGFFDYRFAQPGRTHRQHIGRWYPERQFPFANKLLFDPITGKTDGRLRQCESTETCPKIFEINSANEYWVKGGSLLHTDTLGNDLQDPKNARNYLLSSLPHVALSGAGICKQPRNPLVPNRVLRALLVALDEWVSENRMPPRSRVPRRSDGTLVSATSQSEVGFPSIPGVTFNGVMTTGDLFDYGPSFEQGILTILPPLLLGSPYPVFVPRTDDDGNDVAGIRLPEVEVPLATYTGWGLRAAAFAGDDLCDAAGQKIDFAQTKADRLALGDPRRSIEERYRTHEAYAKEVARAAKHLHRQRLLLEEDVQRYIEEAEVSAARR
jgi:Alpha/beta hydrolase domain